jgi:prepilin-type N-terminal cleavage/methylation domain-containing protein
MSFARKIELRGYTLIELIVVILVISILGATVMLRMSTASDRAAMTQADQLRRDFSHAQSLALSWGVPLRFSVSSGGTGYAFSCPVIVPGTPCTASGATPLDPATGLAFSIAMTDGVLISPANSTFDFDSLGRPIAGTALLSTSPARTYTISGTNKSVTVTVQPITGFAATN